MWQVLLAIAGGYKVIQALTDEEFPGTRFPESFRKEIINQHWAENKGWCPVCGKSNIRKKDLSVDHRVPTARGGRNSKHNAWVICITCNKSKGIKISLWDRFVGRGGA